MVCVLFVQEDAAALVIGSVGTKEGLDVRTYPVSCKAADDWIGTDTCGCPWAVGCNKEKQGYKAKLVLWLHSHLR